MHETGTTHTAALQLLDPMFAAEFAFMGSATRDISLLQGAFHPHVVVHEPPTLPYAGDWRGLDGVAALIGKMSEVWSHMAVENLCAVRDGDVVHLHCNLRLTSRETRQMIGQPFAEVLKFEDGLLREGTPFYFDTAELLQAIGRQV